MSDLIDRQTAIAAITDELMPSTPLSAVIRAKNRLKELPSVQPDHTADIGKKVSISCGQENDLIFRQAAIDAIDKALSRTFTEPCGEMILKDVSSAQPEQKTDEWIPISKETNPTKSGWYLVTVHEDATNENKRFTGVAEFNTTNGMWYDIDEPTDMYLRWMPFPEPYRGGGE